MIEENKQEAAARDSDYPCMLTDAELADAEFVRGYIESQNESFAEILGELNKSRAALAAVAVQVAVPDTDVQQIVTEVNEACAKWPRFNSAHEGFAVLKEEVDELWDHVKINQKRRNLDEMKKEAKQVAAMALRFMRECCDEITGRK